MHRIHRRIIFHLFILGLMLVCAVLSVFKPDFIKETQLEAIADNDNATLIFTFLNFGYTLFVLFSQSKDNNDKHTLCYELSEFDFRPEHYDLFYKRNSFVQAIPDSLYPNESNKLFVLIDNHLGRDSLWIPLVASFSADTTCECIQITRLKIKYYDSSTITKWKKLWLPIHSAKRWKKMGTYHKDQKIPVYFLLGLTQSQRETLNNNQFKIVFRQVLRFAGGIRSVKKITLQFYLSDSDLRLF